jgi:hypothetical protein
MKSRYNVAAGCVNGKGVHHRKLSQAEKACIIADILAGNVPYMPSQGELCARFGVSSFLVRRVQRLGHNGSDAANGNGDAHADTDADADTSVTIEELMPAALAQGRVAEAAASEFKLEDVPPSLIRACDAADANEREWFVRSKISELWNPVTRLISYVIS